MVTPIWKYVAMTMTSLFLGVLMGGAPSHFFELRERPTRTEVSKMITHEAPMTVAMDLKQMIQTQNEIKIEQARLAVTLESVLNELKRDANR